MTSYFNMVTNTALTGCVRIPALMVQGAGVIGAAEICLRGCEAIASLTGRYNRKNFVDGVAHYTPKVVKDAGYYVGLEHALSNGRPFGGMDWAPLLATTGGALLWSNAGLWGVKAVCGTPHWLYNSILDKVSVLKLDGDTNPFLNIIDFGKQTYDHAASMLSSN